MKYILVVDDELDILETIIDTLEIEFDPSHVVIDQAVNGVEGMKLFTGDFIYDLVITDLNMPEMDGIEFTENQVLLDAMSGLDIRTANGDVARHFGFVGLPAQQLDRKDVTTASLEVINGASFGHFSKKNGAPIGWLPLLKSSSNADLVDASIYAETRDPIALAALYESKNTQYTKSNNQNITLWHRCFHLS